MARSKSSHRWLREHFRDPFVKEAQKAGWRSRASFKLLELNEKDKLMRPGQVIVDLGAAPGGWSQVAAKAVGERGRVIASDILPMDSIEGVMFIQGDFTEDRVFENILQALGEDGADLVISDMAPNMSGVNSVDQTRAMYLAELALQCAQEVLRPGGTWVSKVFQGEGFDALFRQCRAGFASVTTRKPSASRPRSREVYVVGKGFRG